MTTLETRIISGKGLLKIPSSDAFNKAKRLTLYCDVIRLPFNGYYNTAYNPPKGRYATINLFKGDYIVEQLYVEYPRQQWNFYPDPSAQALYAIKCAYAGTLQTFFNLGNALGLPSISVTNNIEDWNHTDYWWDTAKIVCYSDSAIRLVVDAEEFLLCPDDAEISKQPPPPSPPPIADIPPGTSLGDGNTPVSLPYEGDNDDGDTVPYPGDEATSPPENPPRTCTVRSVAVRVFPASGSPFILTNSFYGDIGVASVNETGTNVGLQTYGSPFSGSGQCTLEPVRSVILAGTTPGEYVNAEIVSITPPQ